LVQEVGTYTYGAVETETETYLSTSHVHVAILISIYLSIHTSYSLLSPILPPLFLSFSPPSTSHNPQLTKPLDDILVHARQPLLLEPRLAAGTLHRRLQVLAHKRDEVQPVHGVRVQQLALARVFGGFRLRGRKGIGLGWPVEGAVGWGC
jgi:hypothetical protein